ncbi:MAG: YIP1 family protein [Candidatus Methanoperedens sp.]|nr:YIP1 family protein [Candidatus Methanoperedens sp.]
MEFVEKVKGILTEPSKTFDALKEETIGEAIKYYAVIVAIYAVLSALLFSLAFGSMFGKLGTMMGAGATGGIAMFMILFIFGIIGIFISSAIFHIFVYLVGGRKGLSQTIKAVIYGSTPGLLFGWIPIIGMIAGIWSLVLEVLGIRQLHEITTGKAILAVVIMLVILTVLITVILAAVIAAFVFGLSGEQKYI